VQVLSCCCQQSTFCGHTGITTASIVTVMVLGAAAVSRLAFYSVATMTGLMSHFFSLVIWRKSGVGACLMDWQILGIIETPRKQHVGKQVRSYVMQWAVRRRSTTSTSAPEGRSIMMEVPVSTSLTLVASQKSGGMKFWHASLRTGIWTHWGGSFGDPS
jgi:hypothetical protein